jgi:nucleoside-diphosphate-sugar epimerase
MKPYTALVAGATGVTGSNLIEHLDGRGDWNVIGISRHAPESTSASRFIAVDLLDRRDTEAKAGALSTLGEATDATLLARALEWAATEPRCAGEVFNITNGDCFRWQQLWPKIAAAFDMPVGPPLPMRLADFMADKEPVWQALVEQHGLRPVAYERIASWPFADAVFSIDYDIVSDTQKARRHGFNDCVDTERMFAQRFAAMRSQRIIP